RAGPRKCTSPRRRGGSGRRAASPARASAPGPGTPRGSWAASAPPTARRSAGTTSAQSYAVEQHLRKIERRCPCEEGAGEPPAALALKLGDEVRRGDVNRDAGGQRQPVAHQEGDLVRQHHPRERRQPQPPGPPQ